MSIGVVGLYLPYSSQRYIVEKKNMSTLHDNHLPIICRARPSVLNRKWIHSRNKKKSIFSLEHIFLYYNRASSVGPNSLSNRLKNVFFLYDELTCFLFGSS